MKPTISKAIDPARDNAFTRDHGARKSHHKGKK